jgi:hypothetical protein
VNIHQLKSFSTIIELSREPGSRTCDPRTLNLLSRLVKEYGPIGIRWLDNIKALDLRGSQIWESYKKNHESISAMMFKIGESIT